MKRFFAAYITILIAGSFFFSPQQAEAIPAFARKFQTSCDVCHRGFPQLTEFGEKFKEQGFQNKSGGDYDGGTKGKSAIDDKLSVEKAVFPLSIRILGDIKRTPNTGDASTPDRKAKTSFEIPHEVELLIGGTLFKNIGYWAEVAWESGATDIEMAYLTFNNLFLGDNTLNVRVGLLPINDWGRPGHRMLQKKMEVENQTIESSPASGFGSISAWKYGKPEGGIEIYGRPADGPVFYNFGLTNGLKGFGGVTDNNSAKNIFGRIGLNLAGQEVGVQGYMGKSAVTQTSTTTTSISTAENRFNRYGFDAIARVAGLQIYGLVLWGHDENPTFADNPSGFTPTPKDSLGYFVNASYQINDMLIGVLQFDYTKTKNALGTQKTFLTPAIIYLPIQNLRTVVEYQFDLVKRDENHNILQNRLNIRLDLAF